MKKKTFQDEAELPSQYGETTAVLIARDPNWMHAYWEIDPQGFDQLKATIGEDAFNRAQNVLRCYDISCVDFDGTNANHWFDIEVGPFQQNWYINTWKDNVSYCYEYGLREENGTFHSLARSNAVHTPRLDVSERTDVIWLEVKENDQGAVVQRQVDVTKEKDRLAGGFHCSIDGIVSKKGKTGDLSDIKAGSSETLVRRAR